MAVPTSHRERRWAVAWLPLTLHALCGVYLPDGVAQHVAWFAALACFVAALAIDPPEPWVPFMLGACGLVLVIACLLDMLTPLDVAVRDRDLWTPAPLMTAMIAMTAAGLCQWLARRPGPQPHLLTAAAQLAGGVVGMALALTFEGLWVVIAFALVVVVGARSAFAPAWFPPPRPVLAPGVALPVVLIVMAAWITAAGTAEADAEAVWRLTRGWFGWLDLLALQLAIALASGLAATWQVLRDARCGTVGIVGGAAAGVVVALALVVAAHRWSGAEPTLVGTLQPCVAAACAGTLLTVRQRVADAGPTALLVANVVLASSALAIWLEHTSSRPFPAWALAVGLALVVASGCAIDRFAPAPRGEPSPLLRRNLVPIALTVALLASAAVA